MQTVEADVTCGQGHGADCLCDVIVTSPVAINYSFHQLWEADRMGYIPTEEEVMGFMKKLTERYDQWRGATEDGKLTPDAVRSQVVSHLRTHGYIEGAPYDLQHCAKALTRFQPSPCWEWDEDTWAAAEDFMYYEFEFHGRPWLAKNLSMVVGHEVSEHLVRAMSDWYGVEINGDEQRRMRLMRDLVAAGRNDVEVAVEMGWYGYDVSAAAVKRDRYRQQAKS